MSEKKGLMPLKHRFAHIHGFAKFIESQQPQRYKDWDLSKIGLIDYKHCDDGCYEIVLQLPILTFRYLYGVITWKEGDNDYNVIATGDTLEELKKSLSANESERHE